MSGSRVVLDELGNKRQERSYYDREHLIPCEKICKVFNLPAMFFRLPERKFLDDKAIELFLGGVEDYQDSIWHNNMFCYGEYLDWKDWGLNKLLLISEKDIKSHPLEFGKYPQYIEELKVYKKTIERMIVEYEEGYSSYYVY